MMPPACESVPPPRHARACRGHPRLHALRRCKTWMAGTSPAMTPRVVRFTQLRARNPSSALPDIGAGLRVVGAVALRAIRSAVTAAISTFNVAAAITAAALVVDVALDVTRIDIAAAVVPGAAVISAVAIRIVLIAVVAAAVIAR